MTAKLKKIDKRNRRVFKTVPFLLTLMLTLALLLSGCGGGKVVLTNGFSAEDVFLINGVEAKKSELRIYLVNVRGQYSDMLGDEIWNSQSLFQFEDSIDELALERLGKVKALCAMAEEKGITLTQEQKDTAASCAAAYEEGLSEEDKQLLQADTALLQNMYEQYALAQTVYTQVVNQINPEISDDDARRVQVKNILFKTWHTGEDGTRQEYSDSEKAAAKEKAEAVLLQLKAGADFDQLQKEYNEDEQDTYAIGKGEQDAAFEQAAFDLNQDEISDVVETADGYRILKCTSTNDEEQTKANKERLIRERRTAAFGEEYDAFIAKADVVFYKERWNALQEENLSDASTSSFFTTYESFFGTTQ